MGAMEAMMGALYKPLGLGVSVLGGFIAGSIFKQIWKLVAHEQEPPKATRSEYGWREILPAAAAQGAVFGLVKAVVDRGGARGFQKLTGVWPGK
jgi:Protein of unknown function (DUF4235)